MTVCNSAKCTANKVNGKLTFLQGHSKFIANQELKIQETPDQLKAGNIPRSFRVDLKGDNVKKALPGDIIILQGILLPHRRRGFMHEHDLDFDVHLEGVKIMNMKKRYSDFGINEELEEQIDRIRSSV